MALPDLKAILTASTEGFDAALKRARAALDNLNDGAKGSGIALEGLKGVLAGVAGAVTVASFVNLIKSSIDAADHLNDLSQKTGVAVETLAGLKLSAEQSGVSLDQVAGGLGKLNQSLASAQAGNKKAAEGFAVLGISLADLKGLNAEQALIKIADAFEGAEDGPEKVAAAVRILGKAGADLIPLLNGGGEAIERNREYVEKYGGVTTDVAQKADAFNDTLAKVEMLSGAFGRTLTAELLGPLQGLADEFLAAKEQGDGFKTVAHEIVEGLKAVALGALDAGETLYSFKVRLGQIGLAASALASGTFLQDIGTIGAEGDAKVAAMDQRMSRLRGALEKSSTAGLKLDTGAAGTDWDGKSTKRKIGQLAGEDKKSGGGVDLAKKQLDQQLKMLDQYISAERDKLSGRNDTLQVFYARDEVSIQDYYDKRRAYRDEELVNVQGAYAKEIAALEAYIAKTGTAKDGKSEGKVIEAQTKLIEVRGKLSKVESDASSRGLKDWAAQDAAVERYRDRLNDLAAQLEAAGGNTAAAFASGFDKQNRSLTAQMRAVLKSDNSSQDERNRALQGIVDLDQIKQQGLATAQLNDLSSQRSVILGDLANQQDRLDLQISLGNKSELQGLADISAANAARIAALQKIIEQQQQIAEGISDPFARSQALVQVDAMRAEMEKLGSQTDLVADKFNAMGASAIENLVNKLGTGTVKAKDLLKGLFSDLASGFLKMQAKDAGNQLFGQGGLLSGIGRAASSLYPASAGAAGGVLGGAGEAAAGGDSSGFSGFLSKLLGSATGGASGAGAGAALSSVTAAASPLTTVFSTLSTAASSAAAALGSMSASSGTATAGKAGGGFFDSLIAKYSGGYSSSGGVASSADYASMDFLASANGNVFSGGNVLPFARGGVVSSPAIFPMAGGRKGLMGEAGPEAIVPLKRGANGKLGVAMQGSGDNLNVHQTFILDQPTPRQNQGQLVNAAAKALDRRRRTRSA